MKTLRECYLLKKVKISMNQLNFPSFFFSGTQEDLFRMSVDFSIAKVWKIPHFGTTSAAYSLSSENVLKFIHEKNLHFDLVINEEFFHDVYLMFGHIFKAPVRNNW